MIVVSTGNKGKIKEIKEIIGALGQDIVSKNDLGYFEDPVEDGDTLRANAEIKARAIFNQEKPYITIADDTGLYVDALDGRPGVYTARYAGEDCSEKDNRDKLLSELSGIENRKARFVTVICVIDTDGVSHFAEGVCQGEISKEEKNGEGFGYDFIFIPDGYQKTFSQIGVEEKNKISHRSKALEKLKPIIEEMV